MSFEYAFEVPFSDVDQHRVVHHPKFLHYLEQARIQLLKHLDLDYQQWIDVGLMLPVSEITVRYLSPLKMGDRGVVTITRVNIRARRSIILDYTVSRVHPPPVELTCTAKVVLLCVSENTHRVSIIPNMYLEKLNKCALK